MKENRRRYETNMILCLFFLFFPFSLAPWLCNIEHNEESEELGDSPFSSQPISRMDDISFFSIYFFFSLFPSYVLSPCLNPYMCNLRWVCVSVWKCIYIFIPQSGGVATASLSVLDFSFFCSFGVSWKGGGGFFPNVVI